MLNPETHEKCVEDCMECYRTCLKTARHCLEKGGRHAGPDHIRLLQDCANICEISARSMIGESEVSVPLSVACAEVCARCSQSCAALGDNDDEMRDCAETRRRCAESSRRMTAVAAS